MTLDIAAKARDALTPETLAQIKRMATENQFTGGIRNDVDAIIRGILGALEAAECERDKAEDERNALFFSRENAIAARVKAEQERDELGRQVTYWQAQTLERSGNIAALEAERDALKEALKPFADEAFRYEPDDGDSDLPIWDCQLTLGNLRTARSALESSK